MADCFSGIDKNIVSTCVNSPVGGVELTAYIGNRDDVSFVYDATNPSKITGFTVASGKQLYTATGVNKNMSFGHTFVKGDITANSYIQSVTLHAFQFDSASVENISSLNNVVCFFVRKQKTSDGDGSIVVLGSKTGLYLSEDTANTNENNSARVVTLQNQEGEGEPFPTYQYIDTDYATSIANLIAALTPAA